MSKRISCFIIFTAIMLFFLTGIISHGFAAAKARKPVSIKIATATKGGTFYPVGVALSELWSKQLGEKLPYTVKFSALLSAGSKENITLLKEKKAEMAILQGLFGSLAWNPAGTKKKKPYRDFRAVSMLWPNVEHFVLLKTKVKTGTVLDIKGTRFSIGRPLSGTEKSTLIIMNAVGISKKNIISEHFGYAKAADTIKKGKLEGASLVAGPPVPAVRDLYSSKKEIAVLEFTDEQLEQITGKSVYPGFRYIIPPGTYPGQKEEIKTIAQPTFLAVRADVDEELVYQMTKAVYENLDFLVKKHPATRHMNIDSAVSGLPIPLHPGALRYYKEAGLEIPKKNILK